MLASWVSFECFSSVSVFKIHFPSRFARGVYIRYQYRYPKSGICHEHTRQTPWNENDILWYEYTRQTQKLPKHETKLHKYENTRQTLRLKSWWWTRLQTGPAKLKNAIKIRIPESYLMGSVLATHEPRTFLFHCLVLRDIEKDWIWPSQMPTAISRWTHQFSSDHWS